MRTWQGQGVSEGIGIGRIQWIGPRTGAISAINNESESLQELLSESSPEREQARFRDGLRAYRARLDDLLVRARQESDQTKADVLDFYCEMADDPDFCEETDSLLVNDSRLSASQAVRDTLTRTADDMEQLPDVRLRERAADVRAFRDQLIAAIEQGASDEPESTSEPLSESNQTPNPEPNPEPIILVGSEISPVDLAALDLSNVCGLVSANSGPTSHLAILAQSLEIPAVVAIADSAAFLTEIQATIGARHPLILDGQQGLVVANPTAERLQADQARQLQYAARQTDRESILSASNRSADGGAFELRANIALPSDIPSVLKYGAHGVGVLRSEFILGWSAGFAQSGGIPTEGEQFAIYRRMVEDLQGLPLTVRTFDVGGDKPLPGLEIPAESNPFLGLRGCRLYDRYTDVLLSQIRAILRAAAFGPVEILFPMITDTQEAQACLGYVEQAKERLAAANVPFGPLAGTGLMVETPAAALCADQLAPLADFLSIGTNDLTQYTLAADRGNPAAAGRYRSDHPAVLQLIKRTIDAAHRFGKRVCVCGELAGDPEIARTLLDFGLDEWSMTPARIPAVKRRLIE